MKSLDLLIQNYCHLSTESYQTSLICQYKLCHPSRQNRTQAAVCPFWIYGAAKSQDISGWKGLGRSLVQTPAPSRISYEIRWGRWKALSRLVLKNLQEWMEITDSGQLFHCSTGSLCKCLLLSNCNLSFKFMSIASHYASLWRAWFFLVVLQALPGRF